MNWQGSVSSAERCQPLPGVEVEARLADGQLIARTTSDARGDWAVTTQSRPDKFHFTGAGFMPKTVAAASLRPVTRLLERRLVGYQEQLWFFPGDSVALYMHAPAPFHARLYRHGLGREQVSDLGTRGAHLQQVPDDPFVTTGPGWSETLRYRIPADARPGLFSVRCESTPGGSFSVPMAVSTPVGAGGAASRLLVLASTTTWQAYNFWGGRNLYRCTEGKGRSIDTPVLRPSWSLWAKAQVKARSPATFIAVLRRLTGKGPPPAEPEWRFQRLDLRRPHTNAALDDPDPYCPFTNHLAAGEWRLLAWLERHGVPYDFAACHQLHSDPELLSPYQVVILSTHTEYWSRAMFDGLRRFHFEKGGWVLNIAGNSIFREVDLDSEGGLNCVSRSFAASCADETAVLCVRHTDIDNASCAPYRAIRPNHWAFAGAPLPPNRLFGGSSLNQNTPVQSPDYDPGRLGLPALLDGCGASGWETDKLSRTAPADAVVIAKGQNPFGGADMVVRDPLGSRGGLFSASSITFSGCLLIDAVASTVVLNVLEKALGRELRTPLQGVLERTESTP